MSCANKANRGKATKGVCCGEQDGQSPERKE